MRLFRRFIITGSPGCGKTTVLSFIAAILSQAIIYNNPELTQEKLGLDYLKENLPIPAFIPLSRYADYLKKGKKQILYHQTLLTFISQYVISRQCFTGKEKPDDFFKDLLCEDRNVILLLDGLDEIADESLRAKVRESIDDLVTARPQLWVIVTCRSAAYKERTLLIKEFTEIKVNPLKEEHIYRIIELAYHHLYANHREKIQNQIDDLVESIKIFEKNHKKRFHDQEALFNSPLLIRLLLIVHYSNIHLPEQRAELYQKILNQFITPEYLSDEEQTDNIRRLLGDEKIHRDILTNLAFFMHCQGEQQGREINKKDAEGLLLSFKTYVEPFLSLASTRGGLFEGVDGGIYRFSHLSFQEFLTARYLAEVYCRDESINGLANFLEINRVQDSWWREVILLLIGYLSINDTISAEKLIRRMIGLDNQSDQRLLHPNSSLASAELVMLGLLDWPNVNFKLVNDVRKQMSLWIKQVAFIKSDIKNRSVFLDTLGNLGDPRFDREKYYLPKDDLLGFTLIQEGEFLMGSDPRKDGGSDSSEQPQHNIFLDEYYLGRYPVTVEQYRTFLEKSSFQSVNEDRLQGQPNHPIRNVTWHEAVAYCQWLDETLHNTEHLSLVLKDKLNAGWHVRLPSEAEWEKAARGTDGRVYPWQGRFYFDKANMEIAKIGTTSAVGCFPSGTSPYEILDMSGNVWEWTLSLWGMDFYKPDFDYPYSKYLVERENTKAGDDILRVLRGGAFNLDSNRIRCAFRYRNFPNISSNSIGFRVILSPKSFSF